MRDMGHGPRLLALTICSLFLPLTCSTSAQIKHLAPPHATVPRQSGPSEALDNCCFRKVFGNEYVRVLRLQMNPHQSTVVNRRSQDYLIIPLEYANMQTVGQGSSFDFEMRAGQMQVIKGGWPQGTVNAADSALDVLEFEVTHDIRPERAVCGVGGNECSDGAFGKDDGGSYEAATLFETPTLKLRRVELGPGGTLAEHRHAGGDILLAASATDLTNDTGAGAASQLHLDPGQVQWFAPGTEHSLHNESKRTAKFYELEVK